MKDRNSETNLNIDDDLKIYNTQMDDVFLIKQIENTKLAIDQKIDHHEKRKTVLLKFKRSLKLVAVLAILSLVTVFIRYKSDFLTPRRPTYTSISSKTRERKKVLLPDGTIVWLNAKSKITFDNNFNNKLRQLSLEGEAFFEVKRNVEKPFIVKTGNLETKVLGTKFNIQAYSLNKMIEVALLEGKIAVSINKNQKIILLPNQSVCFNKQSNLLTPILKVNTERYAAWRIGNLIFDRTPLKLVLNNLERNFNVKIQVSTPSLNHIKINGKFSLSESPEAIIESICKLIDARYKVQNKIIMITEIQKIN